MGLGLPGWGALIGAMGEKLGFDPMIFRSLGDNLQLAEFYRLERGSIGPLRSELDRAWHGSSVDIGKSDTHRIIAELAFPTIYTTNFDRWLELAHEHHGVPYQKVVTARDLVEASSEVTHIVKFHGDFDSDESLVLAESDYFERLEFESPLDLRLRADVIGRSVLFIGYSLADINLRLLFYKLTKLWNQPGTYGARPKSYIFLGTPNPVSQRVLRERGIEVLSSDEDDPGVALTQFLTELRDAVAES